MNRRAVATGFMVLLILGLGFAARSGLGSSTSRRLGHQVAEIRTHKDVGAVVAQVNKESVTLKAVEMRRLALSMNNELAGKNDPVSRQQALDDLVPTIALRAEARKKGLIPTEQEIDERIRFDEEQWGQAPKEMRDQREKAEREYRTGLGQSPEDHKRDIREMWRIGLMVAKLKSEFMQNQNGTQAEKEAAYASYVNEVVNNARVEVLRPDLLAVGEQK